MDVLEAVRRPMKCSCSNVGTYLLPNRKEAWPPTEEAKKLPGGEKVREESTLPELQWGNFFSGLLKFFKKYTTSF